MTLRVGLHEPLRSFACAVVALGMMVAPTSAAARTTPIDINTSQVWGDADDGQVITLTSPVNYGAGTQSTATVHFGAQYSSDGLNLIPVGLSLGNSTTDSLYATLQAPTDGSAVVILSNPNQDTSTPQRVVNPASIFNFGDMYTLYPGGSNLITANMGGLYGPFSGSAEFQFLDLSSTGSPGDFELLLTCTGMCTNVGFSLAGVNFSAMNFDAASAPPQLVSYNVLETPMPWIANGTWDFVFRNSSAVPEPGTWASMMLGFALIGGELRRKRKLRMA